MMRTYKVTMQVNAENMEQVNEKMQAFHDLQENLEHEDLINAVDVVVDSPEVVDFIKEVTPPDGQELSMGDYINIAKKAFERFG